MTFYMTFNYYNIVKFNLYYKFDTEYIFSIDSTEGEGKRREKIEKLYKIY